jgi:hypothetical protein
MAFASGVLTFKRFRVEGPWPTDVGSLVERLAQRVIQQNPLETADGTRYGWTAGLDILDTDFDVGKNVVSDGLHFGLRVDTNKAPADLVRSYRRMHEQAMLSASGRDFLTQAQRREAREQAAAQAEAEAREGAFRRMKHIPVFWDLPRGEVYLAGGGATVIEHFMSLFHASFDCALVPVTAGELAARWAVRVGETGALDACRPAYFVHPPDGFDSPEDPSDAGARSESQDFLGAEWLAWLWYVSQAGSPDQAEIRGRRVTVFFEKKLELQCAFRMTGSTTVSADQPTRLPESVAALALGKLPVKAGLQLAVGECTFELTLRGDMMQYSGVRLPAPEGSPVPRELAEQRIEYLRDLIEGSDALYAAFLKRRLPARKWSPVLNTLRDWIAAGTPSGTASEAGLTAAS